MNLLSPWSLLWLAPLAGGIIALWMLRLRRQDVTVSSLYLWRQIVQETQANAPFQKLRRNILLFLQLLAAILLIMALARPFVYGKGVAGRAIVLMIDASASMNAKDAGISRLDAAKQAAADFVDHKLHSGDVVTVIAVTSKPISVVPFTGDADRVKQAIDGIEGTDTVADMPGAFSIAQGDVGAGNGALIRVYTDGGYDPDLVRRVQTVPLGNTDVRFETVGSTSPDNVAITAMDARRNPVSNGYEVFVAVKHFGNRSTAGATISLLKDDKLIDARPLELKDGQQTETFTSSLIDRGGIVTARLDDIHDDLATDNTDTLVLPPPRKRKVLLVTEGNLFLERGLNLDPDVILDEVSPADFATIGKSGAGYGMVVFDGWLPSTMPPGNYLVFNAEAAETPLLATGPESDSPALIDQNRTHPVMRFVELSGLSIMKSAQSHAAPWANVLADGDSGPLIAAGAHDGRQIVNVGFDLSNSDWPLRVSFPIFLANTIDWLTAGSGLGPSSIDTPTGSVAAVTVPPGLSSVTLTGPNGKDSVVATPATGGTVLFNNTDRAGIYRIHGSGFESQMAVNLLSQTESDLRVKDHPELARSGAGSASGPARRIRNDLWPMIASVALGLLALEWLLYHRRLV